MRRPWQQGQALWQHNPFAAQVIERNLPSLPAGTDETASPGWCKSDFPTLSRMSRQTIAVLQMHGLGLTEGGLLWSYALSFDDGSLIAGLLIRQGGWQ